MTMALCLYCGKTKFGALVPCPYCQTQGTGHMMLDIKFSDHNFSHTTLEQLGEMIERIREVCPDNQERYNAFFYFVKKSNPSILQTTFSPEQRRKADEVLTRANITVGEVRLVHGGKSNFLREFIGEMKPSNKHVKLEATPQKSKKQKQQQPIWKFWKWSQMGRFFRKK